jgi:hypothetical protein
MRRSVMAVQMDWRSGKFHKEIAWQKADNRSSFNLEGGDAEKA